MSQHAVIVATARVRPGEEIAFAQWQTRQTAAMSKFPGFIGVDFLPPPDTDKEGSWTIIASFETEEQLHAWHRSPERFTLLSEVTPLLASGNFGETLSADGGTTPTSEVTQVIFSKVKPGKADDYREWAGRIQTAQARYAGYRGMYLQPPAHGGDGHWASILRYDSAEHLEAWMNSPERKALLTETADFIETEEFMRLQTSFPGWVPIDPATGEAPPNWKTALLVLLGLFPIVMLEIKYLDLARFGLHTSLATFIGNTISVALTSFLTMPLFVRWFGWWLFPKGDRQAVTRRGLILLAVLFALEVLVMGWVVP